MRCCSQVVSSEHREARVSCKRILSWAAALALAAEVLGATYYLDPAVGSMTNAGSATRPWSTLESVAKSRFDFNPGDVLVLRAGHHGSPRIRGANNAEVLIRVASGETATLTDLNFRSAEHWRVRGLTISPETGAEFKRSTLVSVSADSSRIAVERCKIYTTLDSSSWTADDWNTKACNGIEVAGSGNAIEGNHLLNVNFGISVSGAHNRVARNTVENFSGDGMRGLGDYGIFEFNTVKNCYDVNDNHDDGFQSWSRGPDGVGTGVVRGVIVRGNRIINYDDPDQPHRGTLQGIGCFDGYFEDWLIENNVILVDHWHGITLGGARNCRIINNTVADLNEQRPGPPWIRISEHKNGGPSSGNLIRNNIARVVLADANASDRDHNVESSDYGALFRDHASRDLRLKLGSPAIDKGSPKQAPSEDADRLPRPVDGDGDGKAEWDAGAYEYKARR